MHHEDIVIHTGYSSRDDLSIYVDGFLKGQAAAGALIAEHLASLGFDGAHALVTDVLELKRYRFLSKGESDEGAVPCPVCGRLTPSPR